MSKSLQFTRAIAPHKPFEQLIHLVRGQKVMLDDDLAQLYGVPTKRLNEAVKRNQRRFPERFTFQLTTAEARALRSQFATSKKERGGRRHLPHVFTEHGVVMLSSVLNSARAIKMGLLVVDTFVRLRELIATNKDIASRIEKLERGHANATSVIEVIVEDIERLAQKVERIKAPASPYAKRRIGYIIDDE